VLADVHLGNVGEVRDEPEDDDDEFDWDLAITDPGVMVPLDPRWLSVDIPALEEAA